MSASSIIQAQETGEKNKVGTDVSPSVDRGGVENALLEVEAQIRAQETAHAQAIARLTQVRDTLRNALDPEGRMKELITALDLERQYHEECLATLKDFGFLGENNQPPSFENVSHAFSLSELEAASRFQSPKLLVVPNVSFASAV